ncbi:MAG TPA: serpin family protein [Spirochaetota bacterium]|nr:serpin family protein [Spirochaetota bacterium]
MKRYSITLISFFTWLFIFTGYCFSQELSPITIVAKGNNASGFALFKQIDVKQKDKNIFISPFSIAMAFGMAYEGASGNTAKEIASVFAFIPNDKERWDAFSAIYKTLNPDNAKYKLAIANAFWVQQNYPLLQSYTDVLKNYYHSEAYNVDFTYDENRENVVKQINAWAAKNTYDKIRKVLTMDDVKPLTRLVLTNAVYFKANWLYQFDKEQTKKEYFYIDSNKKIKTPMMMQRNVTIKYMENNDIQMIELPYEGKALSMFVILPKKDIKSIIPRLSTKIFESWRHDLMLEKVDVYLPKFKIECGYMLVEPLIKMGIKDAFNETKADFSKITGGKDLYISTVIHKTFCDVNEEGTEAAAVTAIVMNTKSMVSFEKKIFKADHPFIYAIVDNNTGVMLFLGKMVEPEYK